VGAQEEYNEEDAELLAQMRQDFLEECQEFLDQLSVNLAKLESEPQNKEVINEIFRLAHTIKGSASFVGLNEIRELAHKMEDVFSVIRDGTVAVSAPLIDLMYKSLAQLTVLKGKADAGDEAPTDISALIAELEETAKTGAVASKETAEPVAEKNQDESEKPTKKDKEVSKAKPEVKADVKPTPEITVESIKVKTDKLDHMLNITSELITAKNRLSDLADLKKDEELRKVASQINRSVTEMYNQVMKVRMVPLERLFNKFPGVVRNLARSRRKEVKFIIGGHETELDKTVIEQLYDPLVHLLRNAVDHGIEEPKYREKLGKPAQGTIKINAYYEHNNVVIVISDDGRGMNPEDLKSSAVKKGLLSSEEAALYSDEQAYQLIYRPGFSTSKKISDVSGRGVGMNVVSENVSHMRGSVQVRSEANKGTTFIIKLPLTLAILQVLIVAVNGVRYALPVDEVAESVAIKAEAVKKMEKEEVVFFRGEALPFKSLGKMIHAKPGLNDRLGIGAKFKKMAVKDMLTVIVVEMPAKKLAIAVDYLVGKSDVVLKPLGPFLGRLPGVKGGSILADGSVTLVLDLQELTA